MRANHPRDHGYRIPDGWVPLSGPRPVPEPEPISQVMAWIVLAFCVAVIVAAFLVAEWVKA